MRIIAGKAKGTKLKPPAGLSVRPTADRVKESVFNILRNFIENAVVLDVFAGTGNLGLEALSRGAKAAIFLDSSPNSIAIIRENGTRTKLNNLMEVYKVDAIKGLEKLALKGQTFDLVFCDPPYNQGFVNRILDNFDKNMLLSPKGVLVIEHSRHEAIANNFNSISLRRNEIYGETVISFFAVNEEINN